MGNSVLTVSDALKKVKTAKAAESLTQKLNQSGIYRSDDIKIKEVSPAYKEYDERDDATLGKEAAEHADSVYGKKMKEVDISADKKINALNTKLAEASLNKDSELSELKRNFAAELTGVTAKAEKNGLINSSIYGGLTEGVKANYADRKNVLRQKYAIKSEGIRAEIAIVEENRKTALLDYDLKRAAEYERRLSELKREQSEYNLMVAEYNAKLKALEDTFEEDRQRTLEEWRKAMEEGKI